jgi:hypothetical protein
MKITISRRNIWRYIYQIYKRERKKFQEYPPKIYYNPLISLLFLVPLSASLLFLTEFGLLLPLSPSLVSKSQVISHLIFQAILSFSLMDDTLTLFLQNFETACFTGVFLHIIALKFF